KVGANRKFLDRSLHREPRSLEDVNIVDLERIGSRHRVGCRALPNLDCQLLAFLRLERFAIREPSNRTIRIKHGRSREYRTKQTPTAHLIDSGDTPVAQGARGALFSAAAAGPGAWLVHVNA